MLWSILIAVWVALAVGGQVFNHVQKGHFSSDDAWGWGWFAILVFLLAKVGAFDPIV